MKESYDKQWYDSLKKPSFQPPSSLFGPVWSVLYVMMFISFGLILIAPFKWINVLAYVLFIVKMGVNLAWTPVFFVAHDLKKAFFLCLLLTALVFLTMTVFFYISKLAALLLVPYLLWCSFATVLAFEIWELNSD